MPEQANQVLPPKRSGGEKLIESKGKKRVLGWALSRFKGQRKNDANIAISEGTDPDPTTDDKPYSQSNGLGPDPQDEPEESAAEKLPATADLDPANTGRSQKEAPDQPPVAGSEMMLWSESYKILQRKNPGLVSCFEAVLSFRSQAPLSEVNNNPAGPFSSQKRQFSMANILNLWLSEGVETKRQDSAAGNDVATSELGTSLRNILRDGIGSTPADAIPLWVAACFAAEKVFLHPTEATERDCENVLYIISRIEWYCHLSTMIQGEVTGGGHSTQQRQPKLWKAIVSLYQAVLSYLMAIVGIDFSPPGPGVSSVAISNALGIRRRGIDAVKTAERELPLFDRVHIGDRLEGVLFSARAILNQRTSQSEHKSVDRLDSKSSSVVKLREKFPKNLDVLADPGSLSQPFKSDQLHLLHGHYRAMLSTTQYQTFHDWSKTDGTYNLLYISGGPGSGKTIFLTSVVQALLTDNLDPKLQDSSRVSFFFFSHNRPHTNHPAAALHSLILLILQAQPMLARHLDYQLASTGRDSLHQPQDFLAISAVFYKILEDDEFKDTFLVVDALDQCFTNTADPNQPGIEEFLFLITQSLALSDKIRWLVSFDSDNDGEAMLRKALVGGTEEKNHYLHIDLESGLLDSRFNKASYIEASVHEIAKCKLYDDDLESSIIEQLCEQPSMNYLWVDTVCAVLRADEVWYAPDVVKDVKKLASLSELYAYLHNNLERLPRGDGKLCIRVLSAISLLHEPIQIDEFQCVSNLGKRVDVRNILRKCSAFLHDVDGQVWFLHPFAKKYIERRIISHSPASIGHKNLVRECLDYLGSKLAGDTGTTTLGRSYSLLNWLTHLDQISDPSQDTEIQEKIHWFFANHFLPWVEQLVACGQLTAAGAKLHKIDLRLQREAGSMQLEQMNGNELPRVTLQALIRDALLFVYLHQSIQTPPDVPAYNTLAFCSDRSLIRRFWMGKTLPSISPVGPIYRYWGHARIFRGHTDWIRCVAFSSDGRLVASGSDDETVRIWDVETGETQHKLEIGDYWIYSVAFSSQRNVSKACIVAVGSETSVTIWDANRGLLLNKLDYGGRITSLAFSANARMLAVASYSTVHIWDIRKLLDDTKLANTAIKLPFETIHHDEIVWSVAFSPDGRCLVTGANDAKIRVWSMESICNKGQPKRNMDRIGGGTGSIKDLAKMEDLETGNRTSVLSDIEKAKDGSDSAVEPKKPNAPEPFHIFEGHSSIINCVVFSADSTLLASCSNDGTSRIWHLGPEKRELIQVFGESGRTAVTSVSFLPSKTGSFLASCTNDGIELWDVGTGRKVGNATSQQAWSVFSPAFSPDGTTIATGSTDNAVHVWYGTTWEPGSLQSSEEKSWIPKSVVGMALSPDGQTVATSHATGGVKLRDIKTNKTIMEVDLGHTNHFVAFSPRGGMLLTSSMDPTVRVYKVPSGDILHKFSHRKRVRCAAWSHDEMHVASASEDGTVRIWKIGGSGEEAARPIHCLRAFVTEVAFSPDGEYLVTSGQGKRVLVWSIKGALHEKGNDSSDWYPGREIKADSIPRSLAISLDSKRVVLHTNGMLKVFAIETGEESIAFPEMKLMERSTSNMAMWFDARFEGYVMTLQGAQSLDADRPDRVPRKYPYGIVKNWNGLYITYNGKKLLFFSTEVADITDFLVGENFVVLGMYDGGVEIFSFDDSTVSLASEKESI